MDVDVYTLHQAKSWLRERINDGAICPCCTQFSKVYKRAVNTSLAAGLISLYRIGNPGYSYHHISEILSEAKLSSSVGREFSILRYWFFIEEKPKSKTDAEKKTSGYWKITPAGIEFVHGRSKAPRRAKIYDGRCLGFDGEQVDIQHCLGKKFSYPHLMSGTQ